MKNIFTYSTNLCYKNAHMKNAMNDHKIFKPSSDETCLESTDGKSVIALRDHFFLAATSPMLSLTSPAIVIPPGVKYAIYQAVRLSDPVTVQGVKLSDYTPQERAKTYSLSSPEKKRSDYITTEKRVLPAGSLLLRRFDAHSGAPEGAWYGLTPAQEDMQNMQRILRDATASYLQNRPSVAPSYSTMHSASVQRQLIKESSAIPHLQKRAHLEDVSIQSKAQQGPGLIPRLLTFLR